ncbi:ABC transporter ATP-binding protein [Glycomyces sp. A-F 0318]|uniref:ABC transporter ATP-binding protein n=1 Tax=Glycomyces amatae TaxID=2881355 RepID=UPI001E2A38C7|nr:ABC transporter ATP-binding protein [Glycomyces amatae]MCD0443210.1 ABC transporter ATP-binding protein [Glycomyces amatae]
MNDAAIRVRGLRKTYGGTAAVAGLDLDVRRGETLAVLGPNGAGKSTTVQILSAQLPRDGGDVAVLGTDPAKADRRFRARLGIVSQTANDLLELTVGEVVRHFARYYPDPRDPGRVIAEVGLTRQSRQKVRELSGGQRRRVDVALGVVGNPELLFLDEPTTGFDPEARRQFWDLVRSLAADGTTILLTTHYLDEAAALADRIAVIADGRIRASGTVADLVDDREVTVAWRDGEKTTDAPTALIAELGAAYAGEVPGLTVTRPSLEDAYLRLTGEEAAA